jgi:hypothetical protein
MPITIKNLHSQLPEDQLHEAKGHSTASNNTYLKKNHDGSSEWLSESWLQPVLGVVSGSSAPATEVSGDRYILTGSSFHADWDTPAQYDVVEFNGTSWISITAVDGMRVVDKSDDSVYYFNTSWNQVATGTDTNLSTTDLTQTAATRKYDIDDYALVFEKTSGTDFLKIDANNSKITSSAEYTEFNGQAYSDIYTLTDAATITPDFINGNVQAVTLGDNRIIANPTSIKAGATYIIILVQDATGSRTITWGTKYKFSGGTAPTLTTTASKADVITLVAYSTDILMVTSVLNFAIS